MVEDDDVIGASCSNRTVFLTLSGCSSWAVSDPLLSMWIALLMFSPSFSLSRRMRSHVDPPSALVPGFHKHIPYTSLNSTSFPLIHSLCLGDSVFVCIHPCFSRQGSLKNRFDSSRHSLLCGLTVLLCDASAALTGQHPVLP